MRQGAGQQGRHLVSEVIVLRTQRLADQHIDHLGTHQRRQHLLIDIQ